MCLTFEINVKRTIYATNIAKYDEYLSEFLPGFPKEKNQNREQLQSSGKHVKRENQLGQGRKDPEVSGRADQGKTGTHIV